MPLECVHYILSDIYGKYFFSFLFHLIKKIFTQAESVAVVIKNTGCQDFEIY